MTSSPINSITVYRTDLTVVVRTFTSSETRTVVVAGTTFTQAVAWDFFGIALKEHLRKFFDDDTISQLARDIFGQPLTGRQVFYRLTENPL